MPGIHQAPKLTHGFSQAENFIHYIIGRTCNKERIHDKLVRHGLIWHAWIELKEIGPPVANQAAHQVLIIKPYGPVTLFAYVSAVLSSSATKMLVATRQFF